MYADNNEYEQVMIYQESDVIFVANVIAGDVVKITLKHFHIEIHCPGHDKLEYLTLHGFQERLTSSD